MDHENTNEIVARPYTNNIIHDKTIEDQIRYLHTATFSPCKQTWLNAINKGYFDLWPTMTKLTVKRYLQKSIVTAKGHLDQERINLQYTKSTKLQEKDVEKDEDFLQ